MRTFKLLCLILVLSGLIYCGKKRAEAPPTGALVAGSPAQKWIPRTDRPGKNLWTIGHAALDPSDSTRFIVSPNGDELINTDQGSVDIFTEQKFGDVHIELEFMIPVNGNSGVYPMGEYEVQIWDSFSKPIILANQWLGTIVATAEPTVHPEKGGGQWQQLSIDFLTPRFDANGNKIANAKFLKVILNGVVIHENVEVPAPTPVCLTGKESTKGPVMFQGFVGPVAYRNIKIEPLQL